MLMDFQFNQQSITIDTHLCHPSVTPNWFNSHEIPRGYINRQPTEGTILERF